MISKTSKHALKALIALAQLPEGTFAGATSIAKKIGAPKNYLGKLLQTLSHQGLVSSQKGMGGGFRLARDPLDITLYEAIGSIEHIQQWSDCILDRKRCSDDSPCPVHNQWKKIRDGYIDFLEKTTIAELVHHQYLEEEK